LKRIFLILFFIPILFVNAQGIGKLAKMEPSIEFPANSWGADLMFSDGGFGVGTFFIRHITGKIKGFIDLSFSEQKSQREFTYYDYYGRPIVVGKKNRVFYIPISVGVHYRLFQNILTDNLRPYFSVGVGPAVSISTPYSEEFFNSFKHAQFQLAVGGYIGFGAEFGLSRKNLLGMNMRYYYSHLLGDGVEPMFGVIEKNLGGFYITLSLGIMY